MKTHLSLAEVYWRSAPDARALRLIVLVTAGVCLLTISAQFKVPSYPVPVTLQTLVFLLLPLLAGSGAAVGAVAGYLALGAMGAPVFAGGGGLAYLSGPTGGFLLGFIPAVLLLIFVIRRRQNSDGGAMTFLPMLLALAAADAVIFACGYLQLAAVLGDWQKAYQLGVAPFLIADAGKVVIAAAAYHLARRAGGARRLSS